MDGKGGSPSRWNAPLETMQVWCKPQPGGALAVLVVNAGAHEQPYSIGLDEIVMPGGAHFGAGTGGTVRVRDLWARRDAPPVTRTLEEGAVDGLALLPAADRGRAARAAVTPHPSPPPPQPSPPPPPPAPPPPPWPPHAAPPPDRRRRRHRRRRRCRCNHRAPPPPPAPPPSLEDAIALGAFTLGTFFALAVLVWRCARRRAPSESRARGAIARRLGRRGAGRRAEGPPAPPRRGGARRRGFGGRASAAGEGRDRR